MRRNDFLSHVSKWADFYIGLALGASTVLIIFSFFWE